LFSLGILKVKVMHHDFNNNSLKDYYLPQLPNASSYIVPTLRRGNAAGDATASRKAGALQDEFPRRSVGTMQNLAG
jgi:hypothetical protein